MLNTRQATCLFWGPELINLYNDGFIPLLGEKHSRAMGQRAQECWSDAWPVVGGLLAGVVTHGNAVLFAEMLVPIVRQGRLEDAWWNYSYSPAFDDAGAIAGVLVVATETTAEVAGRKQLEAAQAEAEQARQELHALFMRAPLPMVLLKGPEHRFSLVNGPCRALVNNREVLGKTLGEVFSKEEVDYYRPFLDRVLETGQPVTPREAPLLLPDSAGVVRERFIDVGYHPYLDAAGAVVGIQAVIHDVTDQVVARRYESDLRNPAEAANQAKDQFLATISHELRNPLGRSRGGCGCWPASGTRSG